MNMSLNPDLQDIIGEKLEQALAARGDNREGAFGGVTGADAVRVTTVKELCKLLHIYDIPIDEIAPTSQDFSFMDAHRADYLASTWNRILTDESEKLGIRVMKQVI